MAYPPNVYEMLKTIRSMDLEQSTSNSDARSLPHPVTSSTPRQQKPYVPMRVKDSSDPTVMQVLRTRELWEKERQALPGPPVLVQREQLVAALEHARIKVRMDRMPKKECQIVTSMIGHEVQFSTAPIATLKPGTNHQHMVQSTD